MDLEPAQSLSQFLEHVPVLGLVGNKEYVDPKRQYSIDDGVQLVCKYLKAFETFEENGKNGINKLYKECKYIFSLSSRDTITNNVFMV